MLGRLSYDVDGYHDQLEFRGTCVIGRYVYKPFHRPLPRVSKTVCGSGESLFCLFLIFWVCNRQRQGRRRSHPSADRVPPALCPVERVVAAGVWSVARGC